MFVVAWDVSAQTVSGDRLRLAAPCTMTATGGSPGQWNITDCPILATVGGSTNMTIKPAGDLILAPTGNDILPDVGYTKNLGALNNKYLTLHAAELWVETLVAQNTIATIGGRVLVAPTTTLTSDIGTGATSIQVKHNQMSNGDRVYLEANGSVEWMAITSSASGTGPYTYSVTRNLDGSGANNWYAGDAVLNTGTTGKGYIDLYSLSGVYSGSGPAISGVVRTGTTFSDLSPRWAIGNLNGLFNYGAETYGAAFGDAAATNVTIDATNGFRIRYGTSNRLQADTAGNLSLTGNLLMSTAGEFRVNATSYSTGNGIFMAYNAGTPVMRIGNPAGNRLEWNGTSLLVYGDGGGVTNIDGNQIQTGTINVGSINATGFGGNLVRNGRFEGANSTIGLAGWYIEEGSTNMTWADTNGSDGPGYLGYDVGNGSTGCVAYRASPVQVGKTYRVKVRIATVGGSTTVGYHILMFESTTTASSVRNIVSTGASSPDVNRSGYSVMTAATAGTGAWEDKEFTYTVPSGVTWASLGVCNYSGSVAGSTYRPIIIDGVEWQEQIGNGHIIAASINADRIVAGSITATQIAAGTITATEIASGTITGGKIAAGTITASNIAASTITATELAAGSVTAAKLSVSTLSAITANLGTVTAGSISITNGTDNFNVNSNGYMTLYSGVADYLHINQQIINDGFFQIGGNITSLLMDGGGTQYVCVDNNGTMFASASACN